MIPCRVVIIGSKRAQLIISFVRSRVVCVCVFVCVCVCVCVRDAHVLNVIYSSTPNPPTTTTTINHASRVIKPAKNCSKHYLFISAKKGAPDLGRPRYILEPSDPSAHRPLPLPPRVAPPLPGSSFSLARQAPPPGSGILFFKHLRGIKNDKK